MSEAAVPLPLPEEIEPRRLAPPPRWQADLALVVAAFFFGTTFIVVQDAVERADPLSFLAVRFLIGAAVLAVVAPPRPRTERGLRPGVIARARPLLRHLS